MRAPGGAKGDLWQILEFSKRFKLSEGWSEQALPGLRASGFEPDRLPDVLGDALAMGYRPEQTLYDVLFSAQSLRAHAWPDPIADGHSNDIADDFA